MNWEEKYLRRKKNSLLSNVYNENDCLIKKKEIYSVKMPSGELLFWLDNSEESFIWFTMLINAVFIIIFFFFKKIKTAIFCCSYLVESQYFYISSCHIVTVKILFVMRHVFFKNIVDWSIWLPWTQYLLKNCDSVFNNEDSEPIHDKPFTE